MKWLKRLLFITVLFFGLYFFGDFRINEVNVRDYLQSKVSIENMQTAWKAASDMFRVIKNLYDGIAASSSGVDGNTDVTGGGKVIPDQTQFNDAKKMIQDRITEEDRKKIIKIFEEHLGESEKK